MSLSHYAFRCIACYRCYTPCWPTKRALSQRVEWGIAFSSGVLGASRFARDWITNCEIVLRSCRGWYRAQKTPESRKHEKNTKKNTKSPHPGLAPENTKKIPKKYGNAWAIFVFFRYFFVVSGANQGWGILYFFRNFFVFPFLGSVPAPAGSQR